MGVRGGGWVGSLAELVEGRKVVMGPCGELCSQQGGGLWPKWCGEIQMLSTFSCNHSRKAKEEDPST